MKFFILFSATMMIFQPYMIQDKYKLLGVLKYADMMECHEFRRQFIFFSQITGKQVHITCSPFEDID